MYSDAQCVVFSVWIQALKTVVDNLQIVQRVLDCSLIYRQIAVNNQCGGPNVDSPEVALSVLIINEHCHVVRVQAGVHREGDVYSRPLALHTVYPCVAKKCRYKDVRIFFAISHVNEIYVHEPKVYRLPGVLICRRPAPRR